jgi:hypothetical protein
MLSVSLALFFSAVLLTFVVAWRLIPPGWLTATTGTFGAVIIALHESMGDLMPELKMVMPAEYRPWMMVAFLLLTVAARFRNRAAQQ